MFAWKIFCVRKSVVCRTRCKPSCPAAVPIYPARPVWYRVQTGAACPASGRVVAWSALVLARPGSGAACAAVCRVQSVRVRCGGWGLHLWGIWAAPGVWWSTPRIEKIQKRRFIKVVAIHHSLFPVQTTPTPIVNLKNSAQKTKRPLQRVCVLCYTCLTSLEREESVK